jgi:hypothetical protein
MIAQLNSGVRIESNSGSQLTASTCRSVNQINQTIVYPLKVSLAVYADTLSSATVEKLMLKDPARVLMRKSKLTDAQIVTILA